MLMVERAHHEAQAKVTESSLRAGLGEHGSGVSEAVHEQAVRRVMSMYQRCAHERESVARVFWPQGEWSVYINERRALYDALLSNDQRAASELLRAFWRNELGTIVKEYATFDQLMSGDVARTDRFLSSVSRNYAIWRSLVGDPVQALRVPRVGSPWGCMIDGELIVPKATRFHMLARQVSEIVRERPGAVVGEIGAGYGGMAYYLLRDNPLVRYVDFDLPETLVIAAYYLICSLPERHIVLHGESASDERASVTLLPNYVMTGWPARSIDLIVNTFSFSEMGFEALQETLRQVTRMTRGFLLHHNMDRAGVVNRGASRIPSTQFPIHARDFRLLHKGFDLFHGPEGDYREFLYQRIENYPC